MNENLSTLEIMVGAVLVNRKELPTSEDIRNYIQTTRTIYTVTDDEAERLVRKFETIHGVSMDIGAILEDEEFEPWLDGERSNIDFFYWERYRKMLGQKNFSAQVLAAFDSVTDTITGHLENPNKKGMWKRRGMVVGHVQSGKTANYTGLICKAADAGYKVIIVIAGIHNNLRNQTQIRIDEGFIGFDSTKILTAAPQQEKIVGVGKFDSSRRPNTFTNSYKDFNKATATSIGIPLVNLVEPAIFVIKKNTNTLKNILDWLKEHSAKRESSSIDSPMLLIDDEADNASINIGKGIDEVSRINGQIRQLLAVFDKSCYVGYTATPFANIFIDPDSDDKMFGEDLFPRDFIVSLDPPDNYFGPNRVFVNAPTEIVRYIEDNEDIIPIKHRITLIIEELPASLGTAIRTFILAIAIRYIRGHRNQHNSMLVNASRFVGVQNQLRNEIHELVEKIRQSVRVNGAKPNEEAVLDPEIRELRNVFNNEFATSCEFSWERIKTQLLDSISAIKVIEINSSSSGSLNYSEHKISGLTVIAVGGFSLSRGMTLEGLTVSYFLRNSIMYDTLMQMGRWFGYRNGYDDLCRIWMPEEAVGWYADIAESVEELRYDLRRMQQVNATPRQFGLKVRSHPTSLIVTARNKMGTGRKEVVKVGLANRFIETATLLWDQKSIEINRRAAIELVQALSTIQKAPKDGESIYGGRLVRSIPVSIVIDFLAKFQNHQQSMTTETSPVRNYIEENSENELRNWDVFFAGVRNRSSRSLINCSFGFELVCQRRGAGKNSTKYKTLLVTNKQRVASRGIEKVGLKKEQVDYAEKLYREKEKLTDEDNINYPDLIYRKVRSTPLLIIHLLAIGEENEDLSNEKPVLAWSMSFPQFEGEEKKVEYVANTTWFRENYGYEDEDEASGDEY